MQLGDERERLGSQDLRELGADRRLDLDACGKFLLWGACSHGVTSQVMPVILAVYFTA